MAKAIYNPELISNYDRITDPLEQVKLGRVDTFLYSSAQPSGWYAQLDPSGKTWSVTKPGRSDDVFTADSLDGVKRVIARQHNKAITEIFAAQAIHWSNYYNDPANYADKISVMNSDPQYLESVYRCAANARLHPADA